MSDTIIRAMIRGAYDLQKHRIMVGNRLCANFRVKLGLAPSQKEDDDKEKSKILKQLRIRYDSITQGVVEVSRRRDYQYDGVISDYTELCFISEYIMLEKREKKQFRRIGTALESVPIYTEFLSKVKGIGSAMAGVIISEIDISKAKYASSLHKYAGLDTASAWYQTHKDGQPLKKLIFSEPDEIPGSDLFHDDGNGNQWEMINKGRSNKKEHLVEIKYVDKHGELNTRKSLSYNKWLKTKLMGTLAPLFIKTKSPYADVYYNYRHRIDNMPKHKDKSDGHKMRMAHRYMIKMFLIDLYKAWRPLEGLPAYDPYHEAKLGLKHESVFTID